jgi:hypothetical protein
MLLHRSVDRQNQPNATAIFAGRLIRRRGVGAMLIDMKRTDMDAPTASSGSSSTPRSLRDAFQPVKALVASYIGLALLGFGATMLLRDQPQLVNTAVWVRGSIVLATSALLYLIAVAAARGSRSAYVRLRVISVVVPLAIVVIVALPDPFPVWMKVQQGLCALAVAGVAILANRRAVRAHFAR